MLTLAVLAMAGLGLPVPAVPPAHTGWFSGLPEPVPEASSLALLIVGMAAVGVSARRRQARTQAAQAAPGAEAADAVSGGTQGGQAGNP
jgi:hypothetical protein